MSKTRRLTTATPRCPGPRRAHGNAADPLTSTAPSDVTAECLREAAPPVGARLGCSDCAGFLRRHAQALFEIPDPSGHGFFPPSEEPSGCGGGAHRGGHVERATVYGPPGCPLPQEDARRAVAGGFPGPWTQNPLRQALPGWRRWVDRRMESSSFAGPIVSSAIRTGSGRRSAASIRDTRREARHVDQWLRRSPDDPPRKRPERTAMLLAPRIALRTAPHRAFCRALTTLVGSGALDPATFKVLCVATMTRPSCWRHGPPRPSSSREAVSSSGPGSTGGGGSDALGGRPAPVVLR